jgi:hypothetical protein
MSTEPLDGLPDVDDPSDLSLRTLGDSAIISTPCWITRIALRSTAIDWLVKRVPPPPPTYEVIHLPRWIQVQEVAGSSFWISKEDQVVVEIMTTEHGALMVSCREARTGKLLWQHVITIPKAADWAETAPAWPGGPTEEIHGFLADDPGRLIVCLFRETRRCGLSDPSRGIHVMDLPPYACQNDAIRFDPLTGKTVWQATFKDVPVHIIERKSFTGIWSNDSQVGVLDFENGTNTVLHKSENRLGWPVRDGHSIAVPWHSKKEVGVDWIDAQGHRIQQAVWRQAGVRSTLLFPCESGLAFQANDQFVWWLGKENFPIWNIRAKPYIYRVHGSPDTDVFVATDGGGGRLLGIDAASGTENLNLRPVLGGVGDLAKVPDHAVLVATFRKSRKYSVPPRLLLLDMKDRSHDFDNEGGLLGTWQQGAICLAGKRISVVDIR